MTHFAIYFFSLTGTVIVAALTPAKVWLRALADRPGKAALLILAFVVPFLGGARQVVDGLESQGAARWLRVVALALLGLVVLTGSFSGQVRLRRAGIPAMGMIVYACLAVLSSIYSIDRVISAWKGLEVFILASTVVYLGSGLRNLEDAQWLLDLLSLVMLFFVMSVFAGVVIAPDQAFVQLEQSSAIVVRGVAPVLNSNTLTQFSALLAVFVLARGLQRRAIGQFGTLWIVGALAVAVMLLGHSRTSIFAGLIAAFVVIFFSGYRKLAVVVAAGGIASYTMLEFVAGYILRGQSQEVFQSLSGRTYFWENVIAVASDAPLLGHGFYSAQRLLLGTSTVDNTWLEVLLGLGFLGVFVFSVPIIATVVLLTLTLPSKKTPFAEKFIWLQLSALFILLFVRSLTGPSFQVMHPNLIMFMILAVCTATLYRSKVIRRRGSGRPRKTPLHTRSSLSPDGAPSHSV